MALPLLVVVLAITGCGSVSSETAAVVVGEEEGFQLMEQEADQEQETAEVGDVFTVGYAQAGDGLDWTKANTQNYEEVFGAGSGYELRVVNDSDAEAQVETVREFIKEQLDYIIIAPIQPQGWETVLEEAQHAGIPTIIAGRKVEADASLYDAWVGSDAGAETALAVNWLAAYAGGKEADIVVVGSSADGFPGAGRLEAFQKALKEYSEFEMVGAWTGDTMGSGAKSKSTVESFFQSHKGKFDTVLCLDDGDLGQIMEAMDGAGITYGVDGDVILISFGASREGLQHVLDKKVHCDVECNPLQAEAVAGVMQSMRQAEDYEPTVSVEDKVFVAPGIESEFAETVTEDTLAGRIY